MSPPGGEGRRASDPWRRRVDDVARLVVDAARAVPPTLGRGRLVCIDGPAGSGKSTLAAAAVDAAADDGGTAQVVHVDDLLGGWEDLPHVCRAVEELLRPLAEGRPSGFHPHDWLTGGAGAWCTVEPVDLLFLEGAGAWSRRYAHLVTDLVWVDLPLTLRRARALERDGELGWWDPWARDEAAVHQRERTRDSAGVLVLGDEHELRVELR